MTSLSHASPTPRRIPFLDVVVDSYTFAESLAVCCELMDARQPSQHVVINAGKCVLAHADPELAAQIRNADLVNADGQSVVWAARVLGHPVPERVAGIDLMQALIAECADREWPVYFLGARPEVLDAVLRRLADAHPELAVAGSQHGYYDDAASVADSVRTSGARLLLIAMPSPKKEQFVAEHRDRLGPVLSFGVGGSFDVIAGRTSRAPQWMQRAGLEWFYRLAQEPRRMWKRYLIGNTRFLWLVAKARFKRSGS